MMQQTATVLIKMLGATAAEIHSNTFNVHNNIFNKDKFWKPRESFIKMKYQCLMLHMTHKTIKLQILHI